MDVALSVLCFFYAVVEVYSAIPPDICFSQFKWQDCGAPPKPVVYYYKSGSRCEVGMWRGCLPNPNMFDDEYDCVQTCIFSLRVRPEDYHHFQAEEQLEYDVETTPEPVEETTGHNATGTGVGATGAGEGATAETGGGGAATEAAANAEGATDAGAAAPEGSEATAAGGETPAGGSDAPAEEPPAGEPPAEEPA